MTSFLLFIFASRHSVVGSGCCWYFAKAREKREKTLVQCQLLLDFGQGSLFHTFLSLLDTLNLISERGKGGLQNIHQVVEAASIRQEVCVVALFDALEASLGKRQSQAETEKAVREGHGALLEVEQHSFVFNHCVNLTLLMFVAVGKRMAGIRMRGSFSLFGMENETVDVLILLIK